MIGGLLLLVCLTSSITAKYWREAKRSPFFFLRQQAARRMQSYMTATVCLILVMAGTGVYAWQGPQDNTPRVAVLRHAKPLPESAVPQDEVDLEASPVAVQIDLSTVSNRIAPPVPADLAELVQPATLPAEYDQYEPTAEMTDATELGDISFSTEISDDYEAIEPGRRFIKGFFTIYATFSYDGMADGMAWSWVWRHNGQVVDGGNQVWNYGDSGPGYVYFRPEEGFQLGEYTLEVWVNDELMTRANLTITDGINASN